MPPAYEVTVPAQNTFGDPVAASSGDDDQAALWLHHTSPSTPTISTDDQHNARRVIDTWNQPVMWMLTRFLIRDASDWPTILSGMGSILNLHSIAGDQMTPDGRGIGWGYGSGVSPFHLAVGGRDEAAAALYGKNQPLPALQPFVQLEETYDPSVQSPYRRMLPMVQPGKVYTALIRIQWGRNDFETNDSMPAQMRRPGELDVWASGDPSQPLSKVVEARNANTILRARRPSDGAWIVQRYLDGWDGGPYIIQSTRVNSGDKVWRHVHWATLFGETPAQMLADEPIPVGTPNDQRSRHRVGFSPDLGDAHAERVSLDPPSLPLPSEIASSALSSPTSTAVVPAELTADQGWSPPPGTQPGSAGTTDAPLVQSWTAAPGPGCGACTVSTGSGSVQARIPGGVDGADSAYAVTDFAGPAAGGERVYARDLLALAAGQRLNANLAVLQMRDSNGALVYELYVARDRTLRLWSPAGGLGSAEINQSTGMLVPSDGSAVRVEVSARANDSVVVRVDGTDRLTIGRLAGATTGSQRYLEAGVDHYDSDLGVDPVAVSHSMVGVTSFGWLGSRVTTLEAYSTAYAGTLDPADTGASTTSAAPPPSTSEASSAPSSTSSGSPASSPGELAGISSFDSTGKDPGCTACTIDVSDSTVRAAIAGGADDLDTAYALKDFGGSSGWPGRVFARELIRLGQGQRVTANLAVTQMQDVAGSLVWELYVAGSDRTLRLWSPPGGLQRNEINRSTGVVVPNDGSAIVAEVSAEKNSSVIVRVNGVDRISVAGLANASTGAQRSLRVGIDHYDSASRSEQVVVFHSNVGVSTGGWLGGTATTAPASNPPPASAPASSPTPTPAPAPTPTPTPAPTPTPTPAPVTNVLGANLAPTGDFETSPSSYLTAGDATFSWASDQAQSGSHSLKLESTKEGLSRWLTQTQAIAATAGATYEVVAYVRTSSVRDWAGLSVNFWSSGGGYVPATSDSQQLNGTNGWTRLTVRATAPAGAAFLRIESRLSGPGTIWIDDASAVRV